MQQVHGGTPVQTGRLAGPRRRGLARQFRTCKSRVMKQALVRSALLLAALAAACSSDDVSLGLGLDRPTDLRVGESVVFPGEGLQLRLNSVSEDSRCPSDVACVTAGQASIVLTALRAGSSQQTFSLTIPTPDSALYAGYEIRFLDLRPYPVSTETIDPASYIATVVVSEDDTP